MAARLLGAALGALLALATSAAAADWSVVRIGIEGNYPPFSERAPDGSLHGFDVDVGLALCEVMKAKCILVQRDWDQIQDALLDHEVDAIVSSMSITIARKQRFDFTNRYYHTAGRLVGRPPAEEPPEPPTFAELVQDRRVAVQSGTVHERYLREGVAAPLEVVPYPTLGAATAALRAGDVDLVFADAMSAALGFLRTVDGYGFAFLGPPVTDATYFGEGIAMAVRKEDQGLRWKLNRALDEIRKDGTYARLMERYFGFDLYGS
jgi:lysine-arginine-ornithine-binding protein